MNVWNIAVESCFGVVICKQSHIGEFETKYCQFDQLECKKKRLNSKRTVYYKDD